MRRHVLALAFASALAVGCKKPAPTPTEAAGDAFVDRYLKADQEGALAYAALGAETQLRKELGDVIEARKEGAPEPHASWKRTTEEMRGQRVVLNYEVKLDDGDATRAMRIELTDLGKGPRVVLYEIR
jgi:hypothetical protein